MINRPLPAVGSRWQLPEQGDLTLTEYVLCDNEDVLLFLVGTDGRKRAYSPGHFLRDAKPAAGSPAPDDP